MKERMTPDPLLLGPLVRYVDQTNASVWVKTRDRSHVTVHLAGQKWTAPTFMVHGHHFALVELDGLEPGSINDYTVDIDGVQVWPQADSRFPPSRIATMEPGHKLRMAFGSCRKSAPHDEKNTRKYGIDAMRAYALHMMSSDEKWPDLILFLGDQVYADETSDEMRAFIDARRDMNEPPGKELKDFEEYSYLYHLAWTDPTNRWLLSTLPSAMIFDDHDIRDDWNTSADWRAQMHAKPWWHERIKAGLSSYWVYQHLGNMSPEDRADDELWTQVRARQEAGDDSDLGPVLDEFASRVDREPHTYRWSYSRDVGGCRLIVVDSRAARVLTPDAREMLDDEEIAWLDKRMQGDVDHIFIGTSLPYLLSPGLHNLEAWNEAVSQGAWGGLASRVSERVRQSMDMEHWAAFQNTFRQVADMACEVIDGRRGEAPATVTFLSGDVHNSYVAQVEREGARGRILQAVCSPIRNPLPAIVQKGQASFATEGGARFGRALARSVRLPDPPYTWKIVKGPWFDNNLATLETQGRRLSMWWEQGVPSESAADECQLNLVSEYHIDD